jgi:hypothetical protein
MDSMNMNNMNISFSNKITVDEFNFLRESVGWGIIEKNLLKKEWKIF